ncbi:glycosyltransferase [Patescibacteria group bacterium]|nr:glycosyltransferase [Patescibacteria group bacterium]
MLKFSIIIPVRKINEYVKESITRIKKLDYQEFEVFIVTDEKEEYDFGGTRIKLLESGNVGPGEKRNLAVKQATGDILAFLDDDSYPDYGWLTNAAKIFEDQEVYALGGPAVTPRGAEYPERMTGYLFESFIVSGLTTYRYLPKKKRMIDDYPSVNLFVRKSAFDEVGGFPIEFWPGEDTKLCLDLVEKHGRDFPYDPDVLVYHHRRDIFKPYLKQISRYGRHRGQFARIFPKTSRIPMYFAPSIFFLWLSIGFLVSLISYAFFVNYFLSLIIYFLSLFFASFYASEKEPEIKGVRFDFISGVFLTHIYYGVNFLIGIMKKPELKLKKYDKKTGNYVEG